MITLSDVDNSFTNTAVFGTIDPMPELDEMITVRQAVEMAEEMGEELSREYISRCAKNKKIPNSKLVGDTRKLWLLHKGSFVEWLGNRNPPGRPKED